MVKTDKKVNEQPSAAMMGISRPAYTPQYKYNRPPYGRKFGKYSNGRYRQSENDRKYLRKELGKEAKK